MERNRYYVETWDMDAQAFTPQTGVEHGPMSIHDLRKALRQLQGMGYDTNRKFAPSVLVYREEVGDA